MNTDFDTMSKQEDYFEIDEIENLIDNIEMVVHFLESSVPYKWKWVTIVLYQALYGALISTLQGSDPRQTVVDRRMDSGKAVMLHVNRIPIDVIASSFGKDEETIRDWISNPFLINLDEALRRVKRQDCLPSLTNARPLVTTAEEDDAIRRLTKEFRNQFEHFAPQAWIVYTSIMPPIVSSVLRIIRFLEFESNCVNMSAEQEQRMKTALAQIEHLLKSV
jgi:hypothetical protein